jgi:phage repressor protein C with HTH and peptisase S24 domain
MFTHADIWRAIDLLAAKAGYSASGLAKKAGLDPTTFNKSKRHSGDGKPRWPSTESIAKILSVTGTTMTAFIASANAVEGEAAGLTLPLIAQGQTGSSRHFDEEGFPAGNGWERIGFPETGKAKGEAGRYALKIADNSMAPVYREDDILIVSPTSPVRRGDRVVIKPRRGEALVRHLIRQNPERIEFRAFGAGGAQENGILRRDEILWMARVMWASQ